MTRLYHRLYAFLFGYFWLPCPRCGEMFGGHEWTTGSQMVNGHCMCICPRCGEGAA